jgi:arylsulfatase A-like enzyme
MPKNIRQFNRHALTVLSTKHSVLALLHSAFRVPRSALFSLFVLFFTVLVSAADRPNILLIVSDDQGWPDLGCIGTKPIQTPNLDRLATEGVRLTNYYLTWPACTPSRGSILTGRHPLRNGLYDMVRNDLVNYGHRYTPEEYATSPEMTIGLDPREKTLGDVLHAAGYRCGIVGKWDMGQAKRYLPLQRGFDFFYGHGNNGIDYYTHERYGVHSMFAGNARTKADQGTYATDLFKREALSFIRNVDLAGPAGSGATNLAVNSAQRPEVQPWFLYLCFNAPHGASSFGADENAGAVGNALRGVPGAAEKRSGGRPGVQAPAEYIAKYADTKLPENLKRYYAAVTCMDAAIGEVLALIRERGEEQNTLVIFQSDNGGSGNGGNAPLRGQKSTLWEGGLRSPLIARWPGKIPAGRVSDEFLTTLELMPTLAAISSPHAPREEPNRSPLKNVTLDGYNMLPTLAGTAPSPRTEMFWEFRGQKAARIGNYKWIEAKQGRGLYDLASDLGEKQDLTAKLPDKAAEISARWTAWRQSMDQTEPRGPFRDY